MTTPLPQVLTTANTVQEHLDHHQELHEDFNETSLRFRLVTSSATAAPGEFLYVDTTTAAATITLPSNPSTNVRVGVKKADNGPNFVTIVPSGAALIDGHADASIVRQYAGAVFAFNGTNWAVFNPTMATAGTGPQGVPGPAGPQGVQGIQGTGGGASLVKVYTGTGVDGVKVATFQGGQTNYAGVVGTGVETTDVSYSGSTGTSITRNLPYPITDFANSGAIATAYFVAPVSGQYTFSTTTDDGSDFYLDQGSATTLLFNNNIGGGQGATRVQGLVTLVAGAAYALRARWGNGVGGWQFLVQWRAPGDASDRGLFAQSNGVSLGLKTEAILIAGLTAGDTVEVLNSSGAVVASTQQSLTVPAPTVPVGGGGVSNGSIKVRNYAGTVLSTLAVASISAGDIYRFGAG